MRDEVHAEAVGLAALRRVRELPPKRGPSTRSAEHQESCPPAALTVINVSPSVY